MTRPSYIHGILLLWTGRAADARAALTRLRTDLTERGDESAVHLCGLFLVWACVWEGDMAGAAAFAEESLDAASQLGDPASAAIALFLSALVHAHTGDSDQAREEAHRSLELFERLQWVTGTIWPLWALGFAELSSGDPAAADAVLGPLAEMLVSLGPCDPVLGIVVPDEIEALVEMGRSERAAVLVDWLEERGRELDRPWALAAAARGRGLLRSSAGDVDGAVAALDVALTQLARVDLPVERARTLLALGRVLRRAGQRGRAGAALTEARDLFVRSGLRAWAARAGAELARAGARTASHNELTATEARVAELAASGLSNREIAVRAFLTTKAVEANLTRAYRKLGIRSRAALARALQP